MRDEHKHHARCSNIGRNREITVIRHVKMIPHKNRTAAHVALNRNTQPNLPLFNVEYKKKHTTKTTKAI